MADTKLSSAVSGGQMSVLMITSVMLAALRTQKLSDGLGCGVKQPGGGLYADGCCTFDYSQPQIKFVSLVWHLYNLLIVG